MSRLADGLALATLAGVTVLVALVSEVFVAVGAEGARTSGCRRRSSASSSSRSSAVRPEMASAFSGARKNRLDLQRGHRARQARPRSRSSSRRCWCWLSYVVGRRRWTCSSGRGRGDDADRDHDRALVTNSGRSAWFVGVLLLMVYLIFAMTLYLPPPRTA
jgi:Ca2+:H+ antiporter